jgi:hypothetical protein
MKLNYLAEPFPHFLIEDFYTGEELATVKDEVIKLSNFLRPPELTGAAVNHDGSSKKQNLGVFITDVYKHGGMSAIFNARKKLFAPDIIEDILNKNIVFSYLPRTNSDNTLIQFYKNGDYYKSHWDVCLYSFITAFLVNEKKYTGGKLRFSQYDYELDLQHNHSIFFPSYVEHEVTKLNVKSDNLLDSRISITTLIGITSRMAT